MQNVHQHIQATLKDIYRKAIDADAQLDTLNKQDKGKFQAIFRKDQGFSTHAKRFLPYVEELSEDFAALQALSDEQFQHALPDFVAKLNVMLKTLTTFSAS
jgi:primosomal protein N''